VSLRIEAINDLGIAKQVAELAVAENARLYRRLEALAKENAELKGEDGDKQLELELLRIKEQMAALQHRMFGASSEKRSRDKDGEPRSPEPPSGPREQRHLPVEEHVHQLGPGDRCCGTCGKEMSEWAGQDEEVEEVDVVQRQFVLKRHIRKKYRCKCGAAPVRASGPLRLPGGGRYSLDFAIEVAVGKWSDHAPLERQVRIMRREGLDVDSSTLWEQAERLTRVLGLTYLAIREYVVSKEVVHADETPWYMLKKGRKKHWVWSIGCKDAVFFRVDPSRGHHVIVEMLDGFEGVLVVDGYQAYGAAAKALKGKVETAICWAHARRKLVEAEESYPEASEALDLMGEMFLIERDLPDWHAVTDPTLRANVLAQIRETRQEKTKALVDALAAWAKAQRALPKSRLGEAIAYLNSYWEGLCRFLTDARIPMTNNDAERALRGCVVGRKNHYGSKSVRGTEVAALFYTLRESAKLAGVEPRGYLRAAAEAALKGQPPLLPHVHRARLKKG
jgi:transposase